MHANAKDHNGWPLLRTVSLRRRVSRRLPDDRGTGGACDAVAADALAACLASKLAVSEFCANTGVANMFRQQVGAKVCSGDRVEGAHLVMASLHSCSNTLSGRVGNSQVSKRDNLS